MTTSHTPGAAAEIAEIVSNARSQKAIVSVGSDGKSGIALDLSRLINILDLNETSLLCSVQAGLTLGALEEFLAARGLTLGAPGSVSPGRTVGALLSAPRPDEASPRTGPLIGQCAAIGVVLADSTVIATRVAPRKAVGPDLMHAFIGSRGTLGIITDATFRVLRRGDARHQAAFTLPSIEAALQVARKLVVEGARPAELGVLAEPPTLLITVEGTASVAAAERELCASLCAAKGGTAIPHLAPRALPEGTSQRAVMLESVVAEHLPATARVTGWHPRGAAVCDPGTKPTQPSVPPAWPAIKRALDAHSTLPDWPARQRTQST